MNAPFSKPAIHFSGTDAKSVGDLVASVSDIALVVDRDGLVVDVAGTGDCLSSFGANAWVGKTLAALVTQNSSDNINKLLSLSPKQLIGHECTIAHAAKNGEEVVIKYTAVSAGSKDSIILLGRDLSPLRSLQNRLLTSQQTMESSIERHRQDEARYRMLFQISSDPVLVVDAGTGKITEANSAAADMLFIQARTAPGRRFSALFRKPDRISVDELVSGTIQSGSATADNVCPDGQEQHINMVATLYRTGETANLLVQMKHAPKPSQTSSPEFNLVTLVHSAAEAVVLTDKNGSILWGNAAFVNLTQGGTADLLAGQPLGGYFNDAELDIGLTLENVQRHGRIKYITAKLYGPTGLVSDVELSVVSLPDANPSCFGVIIRTVMPRNAEQTRSPGITDKGEAIEELVGRVPLKELVREEIDVVEKNCIETALKLTGNNRAATAKVLGLSRQGLYTKMRRYGLLSDED